MSNSHQEEVAAACKGKIPGFCRPGCKKTSFFSTKCQLHDECEKIKRTNDENYGSFVQRCGRVSGCRASDEGDDQFRCLNEVEFEIKSKNQEGGAKHRQTSERVVINNQRRVVYVGARGGKYVKQNGKFVALSKIKKQ